MPEIVPEPMDHEKRITDLEKQTAWLGERVWYGTGNLHDRVHKLEDQRLTEEMERTVMKEDLSKVEQVLGMNTYGGKNIVSDLREMMETVEKLRGSVISVKDFQSLMNKVDILEKRGQAQITFWNVVQLTVATAIIGIIMDFIKAAMLGGAP